MIFQKSFPCLSRKTTYSTTIKLQNKRFNNDLFATLRCLATNQPQLKCKKIKLKHVKSKNLYLQYKEFHPIHSCRSLNDAKPSALGPKLSLVSLSYYII